MTDDFKKSQIKNDEYEYPSPNEPDNLGCYESNPFSF